MGVNNPPSAVLFGGGNNSASNISANGGELDANTGRYRLNDGPFNLIGFNNFENGLTTGWSLGTTGTLTNGLPTGIPTFGSGTTNLTLGVTTSNPLFSSTSLTLTAAAATTAGNMFATDALTVPVGLQGKVISRNFAYSATANASNGNFSGTSSNSFAVGIYDVTNSAWLGTAGQFNLVQSSETGNCTGTAQLPITTASLRFVIYCANATAGVITMAFDQFYLGPQVSAQAPAMSDWVAYTPTFTGLGTVVSPSFFSRRVGDTLEVVGKVTAGTATATPALITVGYAGGNGNVTIDTTKVPASNLVGIAGVNVASTTVFSWDVLAPASNATTVIIGIQNSTLAGLTATTNATTTVATGNILNVKFTVPIVGWSSNTVSSADTDTRVIAMQVNQAAPTATITSSASLLKFTSTPAQDTAGAFSTSTGLYTCPVSGFYRVSAGVAVAATYSLGQIAGIGIALNSTTTNTFASPSVAGAAEGVIYAQVSGTIYCTAGSTLAPLVNSNAGTPTVSSSLATNFFYVERLSGPAVVQATESVNARYFASSTAPGTSASPNTITYTTKDYDSHNAYSSGTYTIPVSGKYAINAALLQTATTTAANEAVVIQIFKNGSQTSGSEVWFTSASTKPISSMVEDQLNCSAGDTITVKAGNDGTTPATTASNFANLFTIARVGN